MRRRAVGERPEPAQQRQFLVAEAGHVSDRLRARQHRQQAQQQHLVERVAHLAALPRVRKPLEMLQKDDRLAERLAPLHRDLLYRIGGPRSIQSFNRLSPTLSPDCPEPA